jgi:hypothetical protein
MQTELLTPRSLGEPGPGADADASTDAALSSDPAVALLALMLASRSVQSDVARTDVEYQSKVVAEMRAQIQDALKRAEEAQQDSGFWGDVASVLGGDVAAICGLIAAAAFVVATGGAGAPAIVALAAAGLTVGADVGERLGLDPKLCVGLSTAGALLGVLGGNVNGAAGVFGTVAKVANVSQGVATAGGGGAHVAEREFHAQALDAQADAKQARGAQADAWLRLEMALEVLRRAAEDIERGKHTVSKIEDSNSAGRSALIARLGGIT